MKKLNFAEMGKTLSRSEMKQIMAGSGGCFGYCAPGTQYCLCVDGTCYSECMPNYECTSLCEVS